MANIMRWLWLTSKPGMTPKKVQVLLDTYGDIHNIYRRTEYNIRGLRQEDIKNLLDKSMDGAVRIYENTKACGAVILTCDSEYYPECLKNISPMPHVLYLKGSPMNLDNILGIGVVGTRNNTDYGGRNAYKISYNLAKRGAVIVSGLALGIDAISMKAAVKAGGRTIGVLGCGIDMIYPPSNRKLFEEVVKDGLIISEYPPGVMAYPGNFPQRNRIIAGLSKGVLVVEASKHSGSLITARFAVEYDRDLYAVPRNIDEIGLSGTNYLIKDGAKLVMCADDIMEEYETMLPYFDMRVNPVPSNEKEEYIDEKEYDKEVTEIIKPKKPPKSKINSILQKTTSEIEQSVIKLINDGELYIDEIARGLDKNMYEISPVLMMMEASGLIEKHAGDRYSVKF